ncbi:MAG: hypothetical protein LBT51_11030 [Fusobacteriaceae bacterium]|jgi:hypothetical protein|nr:hypothetical protein [Fusobacteriaceae bacterium]
MKVLEKLLERDLSYLSQRTKDGLIKVGVGVLIYSSIAVTIITFGGADLLLVKLLILIMF